MILNISLITPHFSQQIEVQSSCRKMSKYISFLNWNGSKIKFAATFNNLTKIENKQ